MTTGADEGESLLAELRAAVRASGSPTPQMIAGAEAAFSWRTIDAELAALAHDSLVHESALVRSTSTAPRTLVFTAGDFTVEIEHTEDVLAGQLLPPAAGEVTLLGPAGELDRAEVDELGSFTLARPPGGPVRLRCRTSRVVLTDWFIC